MGSSVSRSSDSESENESVDDNVDQKLEFHPTETDVFTVRNFLFSLEILPLELVDVILDLAEYWPRVYAKLEGGDGTLRIEAGTNNSNNGSELCVLTPPIPLKQDEPMRIRYVKFSMRSHDQGWGNPTRGAWTWFEASIIRLPDPNNPPDWLWEPTKWRISLLNSEETFKLSHVPAPADQRCRRWHVQTNVCTSNQVRIYQVVWTPDGGTCSVTTPVIPGQATQPDTEITDLREQDQPRTDGFKGRMNASKEFVQLLQRGDRVALVGRALVCSLSLSLVCRL